MKFNPSNFFKPLIEADVARCIQDNSHDGKPPRSRLLKRANQVKMGHGGTLDPLATGVLILGVGSGTKSLQNFINCTKTYEATVLFGASTDTYDRVGKIITKRPYEHISREKVESALASFRGKQVQMPPLYSALKMNGKPLYEYAREGKPVPREIEGRNVEALEIELVEWYEPGKHSQRWPTEEADTAERNLAEQVWRVTKLQESAKNLTPEEKEEEAKAIMDHEKVKMRFEKRQDELIRDVPTKKQRHSKNPPMMSGALGNLPQPKYSDKGSNLVPDAPAENTPPPWSDEGPPAAKIRLTVTSGYYIRSFCHDLGTKLDSAAIMTELARTSQNGFDVEGDNILPYEDLEKGEEAWAPQVAAMLARWHSRPLEKEKTDTKLSNGTVKSPGSPTKDSQSRTRERSFSPVGRSPKKRPSSRERDSGPSRKTRAMADEDEKPTRRRYSSSQGRSDDEKSWNGISD